MRRDVIGYSEEARPIPVLYPGRETAPLRILIVAGLQRWLVRGLTAGALRD